MFRSMYTAATGMGAEETLTDTLANNLANVNTTGFKKSDVSFQDLLYQKVRMPGMRAADGTIVPSGEQVGSGVKTVAVEKSFEQGAIKITNKDTDLAITAKGFFRIQLPDGNIAYSRDGSFRRSADGRIVTADGLPLVPEIIVPPETENLNVGIDGTVTAKVSGEIEPRNLGQIQLANFVNPSGLNAIGRNLFLATPAAGDPIVGNPGENGMGSISQGQLEASNVNVVEEMVRMITAQRAYELNSKVIKTSDEMLAATNQLK